MENKNRLKSWSQRSEKMQKKHNIGKISNMVSLFWHDMAIQGPKNDPKTVIFPDALFFTLPLGVADVFGRRSYPKRPKTPFLTRRPIPKVLIMR